MYDTLVYVIGKKGQGVKVEPGPRVSGPQDPGTQDPGRPSKFKSGTPWLLQNLKVGPQDPFQSLKVGSPHLSLMNSFFSEYFIGFFYFCVFFK